jgi:hypothetical protein
MRCILSYSPYLHAVSSVGHLRTHHAMVTKQPPNMENLHLRFEIALDFGVVVGYVTPKNGMIISKKVSTYTL